MRARITRVWDDRHDLEVTLLGFDLFPGERELLADEEIDWALVPVRKRRDREMKQDRPRPRDSGGETQ